MAKPAAKQREKTAREALAFVRRHGVVLESARGPAPSLAAWIAGEQIRGSWWGHARGHEIYRLLGAVADSPDVLLCRLVGGKRSFVHRRLWPALIRAAETLPRERLARVAEEHTAHGRHEVRELAFPDWAPAALRRAANALTLDAALEQLRAANAIA